MEKSKAVQGIRMTMIAQEKQLRNDRIQQALRGEGKDDHGECGSIEY
jgi:hypothetical protein